MSMGLPGHHPQEDLLLRYASGELREIKSLLVATHLAYCPACRARVAVFEAQCGAWFDETPATPADGRLDTLLERLHGQLDTTPPAFVPPPMPVPADAARPVPEPLRSWLEGPMMERAWKAVSPGVWLSEWGREAGGSSVCLLRMGPGAPVPAHHHTAAEILLVLQGAFRDEYGQFQLGDVIEYAPDSDHHAVGNESGECICLFLLDGEIVFLNEPGPDERPDEPGATA